jgi:hypothetical protein
MYRCIKFIFVCKRNVASTPECLSIVTGFRLQIGIFAHTIVVQRSPLGGYALKRELESSVCYYAYRSAIWDEMGSVCAATTLAVTSQVK